MSEREGDEDWRGVRVHVCLFSCEVFNPGFSSQLGRLKLILKGSIEKAAFIPLLQKSFVLFSINLTFPPTSCAS